MKRYLIFIVCTILFCSCSTTYRVSQNYPNTQEFIGWSHADLVSAFGAPTSDVDDGAGGYILSFENCTEFFDYKPDYVKAAGASPTVQFFMDQDGFCRRVFTTNNTPVKTYSAGKTVTLIFVLCVLLFIP